MVEFFPELDFVKNSLRPKPTEGENWLLDFLNDYLIRGVHKRFKRV